MVICPERGANDLHMVQLRQLPSHHRMDVVVVVISKTPIVQTVPEWL